jgi:hypothetical protein
VRRVGWGRHRGIAIPEHWPHFSTTVRHWRAAYLVGRVHVAGRCLVCLGTHATWSHFPPINWPRELRALRCGRARALR